jgi:hypothetical protein
MGYPLDVNQPKDGSRSVYDEPLAVLRRWEDSGGAWRVVARSPGSIHVDLVTCTGDDVMGRLSTGDPDLIAFIGTRESSQDD